MKLKYICLCFLCACQLMAMGKDVLILGNKSSEQKHDLRDSLTEKYVGGMGETARRMLPGTNPDWQGGILRFKMKVDSEIPW